MSPIIQLRTFHKPDGFGPHILMDVCNAVKHLDYSNKIEIEIIQAVRIDVETRLRSDVRIWVYSMRQDWLEELCHLLQSLSDRSIIGILSLNTHQEPILKAPCPGKVLQLLVGIGDRVEKGQVVLISESMKMETEIPSTVQGTVRHIFRATGDIFQEGDSLLEVGES